MQKPNKRHKFTSENNIINLKKPVHDPFNVMLTHKAKWFL